MFTIKPIATVYNSRDAVKDDFWGSVISTIELVNEIDEEALREIETFSHLEVIYYFDRVNEEKIQFGARHPRNNTDYPRVGIFAQRGKNRPNRLGASIVKLEKREGKRLFVTGLDAIDGTPVIDIKPIFKEFLPKEEVKQPEWSRELMVDYWK